MAPLFLAFDLDFEGVGGLPVSVGAGISWFIFTDVGVAIVLALWALGCAATDVVFFALGSRPIGSMAVDVVPRTFSKCAVSAVRLEVSCIFDFFQLSSSDSASVSSSVSIALVNCCLFV